MLSGASRTLFCLVTLGLLKAINANELTFELPDNANECFYEKLKLGSKMVLEYQVRFTLDRIGLSVGPCLVLR